MTETISDQTIRDKVVAGILEINPDLEAGSITLESEFAALDLDSIDLVELAQILEDEYEVKLASDDLAEIKTVGDAVALVVRLSK